MIFPHFPPKTFLTLGLLAVFVSACQPAAATPPPLDEAALMTAAVATVYAEAAASTPTQTVSPPTTAPTLEPTPLRTPPALPGGFTTGLLNPGDAPSAYIQDTCQVLKAKWDPSKADPARWSCRSCATALPKAILNLAQTASITI